MSFLYELAASRWVAFGDGMMKFVRNALHAVTSDGISLVNETPASVANPAECPPTLSMVGSALDNAGSPAPHTVGARWREDPVSGIAVPYAPAVLDVTRDGSTWVEATRFGSASPLSIFGSNCQDLFRSFDAATVTSSGGAVSAIANQGALGGTLAQSQDPKKPLLRTCRGMTSLYFDGARELVSSLGASARNFWHDGTGATIWVVYRPATAAPYGVLDTGSSGGANRGFTLYLNTTTNFLTVGNGATLVVNTGGRASFYGGISASIVRLKTGNAAAVGNERSYYDNGRRFEAAFTNAASAGNAGCALNVGAITGLVSPLVGHILEVGSANVFASDDQLDALETYIAQTIHYAPLGAGT